MKKIFCLLVVFCSFLLCSCDVPQGMRELLAYQGGDFACEAVLSGEKPIALTISRVGDDIIIKPEGTEFQKKVWAALREIPYGETRSYGQIAARIGDPKASRAVGMANNKNPLAIVVPCHRVVGANGSLTGYAGGLEVKEYLLKLESEHK